MICIGFRDLNSLKRRPKRKTRISYVMFESTLMSVKFVMTRTIRLLVTIMKSNLFQVSLKYLPPYPINLIAASTTNIARKA